MSRTRNDSQTFNPLRDVIKSWKDRPLSTVCAVIGALVKTVPDLLSRAATESRSGTAESLLFYAISVRAPGELVSTLISLGESAAALNSVGETPLHAALRQIAPPDTTLALLRANPSATLAEDRRGRTPLHALASSYRGSYGRGSDLPSDADRLETAERVLAAGPSAISVFDTDKATPLSLAVQNGAPLSIVLLLLAAVPRSTLRVHLRETGITGFSRVADEAPLRALLDEAMAEAARCSDRDGGADLGGTGAIEGV